MYARYMYMLLLWAFAIVKINCGDSIDKAAAVAKDSQNFPLCQPHDDVGIWSNSSSAQNHPYYTQLQRHFKSLNERTVESVYGDSHAPSSIRTIRFVRPRCRSLDPWENEADAKLLSGKRVYLYGDSLVRQLTQSLNVITHHVSSFHVELKEVYCVSPLLTDIQLDGIFARALAHKRSENTSTKEESIMLINIGIHYNINHCSLAEYDDPKNRSCNVSHFGNDLMWDDRVEPAFQSLCASRSGTSPTALALGVARLMQWIQLRRSQLPRKVFWLQSTPQHFTNPYSTYIANLTKTATPHHAFDDAYVSQHELTTWRNDITDSIVARYYNEGVRLVAAQRVLMSRGDSHVQRFWGRARGNRTKVFYKNPHMDCSHYALDSSAWLEHVKHVLTSIVSLDDSS